MKVANIKAGSLTSAKTKQSFDSIFMQPCYYANIEKSEKRKDWMWIVGCRRENEPSDEFSFKMSKLGDVNDDQLWKVITGSEFAIRLISIYRNNGQAGVRQWIRNNCS